MLHDFNFFENTEHLDTVCILDLQWIAYLNRIFGIYCIQHKFCTVTLSKYFVQFNIWADKFVFEEMLSLNFKFTTDNEGLWEEILLLHTSLNNLHNMAAMDRTNIFRRVSCLSGDILRSHCGPHPAEEDFISMLYYWLAKHLKGIKGKLVQQWISD